MSSKMAKGVGRCRRRVGSCQKWQRGLEIAENRLGDGLGGVENGEEGWEQPKIGWEVSKKGWEVSKEGWEVSKMAKRVGNG